MLAGRGGVRLMRQDNPKAFADVTTLAKLPRRSQGASYIGSWAADIEADGDLDIVLGSEQGLPSVLRNNGDGTFIEIHPFGNISGLRGFSWADIDADGDPDASLIDEANRLHIFTNERSGQFNERPAPSNLASVRAINVADLNNDGVLDILALQVDGIITRLSDKNEGTTMGDCRSCAESPMLPTLSPVPYGYGLPTWITTAVSISSWFRQLHPRAARWPAPGFF